MCVICVYLFLDEFHRFYVCLNTHLKNVLLFQIDSVKNNNKQTDMRE